MASKRLTHEAYRVGWICALEVEQVAAMAMLDEEHESLPQPSGDTNIYSLGSINSHNVVIAGLPTPGNNPAAAVAVHLTRTFPKVHYILLVGIGGGVPVKTDQGAIRLGHVIVSKPTGIHSGAIQYDHGKATVGIFERTGSLAPPPTALLNAATALAVRRQRMDDDPIWTNTQRTQTGRRRLRHFKFPGASHDELYRPGYDHRQLDVACAEAKCDPRQRIERPMGDDEEEYYVVVHRGTIASGELVVKNASLRDQLAREYGVLCFETEAAGALTSFACLVIRGISDYCDSHKNDAWQGYAAAVAAAYARQLFFHMAIEETHKIPSSSLGDFGLPFNVSEVNEIQHFVARDEELLCVRKALTGRLGRKIATIHGLGGIGKTQLAIAYCRLYRNEYSAVLWLNARDETTLQQSYTRVAQWILRYHPGVTYLAHACESRKPDQIVDAVKQWLDEPMNGGWLTIYDNHDNPFAKNTKPRKEQDANDGEEDDATGAVYLPGYLPQADQGAIIITTRSAEVNVGQFIHIGKLKDIDDCLRVLIPEAECAARTQDPAAVDLARQLDGLLIALATAGAYLKDSSITCSEYLKLYHESWRQLHEEAPQLPAYDQTLYSTWNITYGYIQRRSSTAANLLRLWAYFDNRDLWYELLKESEPASESWLADLTRNAISFHSVMRLLCTHGFVEADSSTTTLQEESRGYSVHACVHSWMKYVLNDGFDESLAGIAINCVAAHARTLERSKAWLQQRRLLAHADRVTFTIKNHGTREQCWPVLSHLGVLLANKHKYEQVQAIYERALQAFEKALGRDHVGTLHIVHDLGGLYMGQGKLEQAEAMCKRALRGLAKTPEPDHILTISAVMNLGSLCRAQGKLEKAKVIYKRVLERSEEVCGPDHMLTLMTVSNLGFFYRGQGKLEQAEVMYVRALQGYEKLWGSSAMMECLPALATLESFGDLYVQLGRASEAQEYYQRALRSVASIFGEDSARASALSHKISTLQQI